MSSPRSTRVELQQKCIENCSKRCDKAIFTNYIGKRFPISTWLPKYNLTALQYDIIAGLTVGLMVVPQGLAYALVAGLPPQYGLYSAFMGCFAYCIFGTSKDITLGPTAIMSLIVSAYGRPEIPAFVIFLTLFSGLIQLVMGILKIGFVVNFISIPVVSGFTSSAAIIIAIGQIKDLLGLRDVPRPFIKRVYYTFRHLGDTKAGDLILGLICIVVLLSLRKVGRSKWVKENQQETHKGLRLAKKLVWIVAIARNALIILIASFVSVIFLQNGFHDAFSLTEHLEPGFPPFKVQQKTIHSLFFIPSILHFYAVFIFLLFVGLKF